MHDSVTVHIDAPAQKIWELVSDVRNTGRFSPETLDAEWLDGATAPAVGVRFRGHVKRNGRGPMYWTTCQITECVPGEVFEFAVLTGGKALNTWRYELADSPGGGTDVTESFRLTPTPPIRLYWALLGRWRGQTNRRGMQETLDRIRAAAEAEA